MAKLNRPADPPHTAPTAHRTYDALASPLTTMPSPPLRQIPLEASLQSQGNNNMPPSPPCRGSGLSSLSPADCRTLKKLLSDIGHSSPPATPSPLDSGEQLFTSTDLTSSPAHSGAEKEHDSFHIVGDEAADTGYEDEDDSMELSEGVESPTVSYSDRRLRESISTHDEIETLKYARHRRWSGAKAVKSKRPVQERQESTQNVECNTIEDITNVPGKLTPPARPQDLDRSDSDRQPVPEDIKQLNRMRLSMEKVLENERIEQEKATCEEELGVIVPSPDTTPYETTTISEQQAVHEASDADNEEDIAADDTAEGHRAEDYRDIVQSSKPRTGPTGTATQTTGESTPLVPNNPTTAMRAPDQSHIQFDTNQNVPETPFTKTLSYFKQYRGAENSPSKRRRNTALPQEIADVVEAADNRERVTDSTHLEHSQHLAADDASTTALHAGSALADLEDMAPSRVEGDPEKLECPLDEGDEPLQAHARTNAATEKTSTERDAGQEPGAGDSQKQLILYPQHPAIVNAIGMIPATMFWATVAPIVKYTSLAVDLLIEKLRDTYL